MDPNQRSGSSPTSQFDSRNVQPRRANIPGVGLVELPSQPNDPVAAQAAAASLPPMLCVAAASLPCVGAFPPEPSWACAFAHPIARAATATALSRFNLIEASCLEFPAFSNPGIAS